MLKPALNEPLCAQVCVCVRARVSRMQVLASAICQGSQASPTCPLPTDRSQSSQAASVQLTGLGAVVTQYLLTNGEPYRHGAHTLHHVGMGRTDSL